MNLGAGRVVYQDFTRITKSIQDDEFLTNPKIEAALAHCEKGHTLHLMGLLSPAACTAMKIIFLLWHRRVSPGHSGANPRILGRPGYATT